MKILAGKHKGKTILGPEGDQVTRPMLQRIKRSLFDRFQSRGLIHDDALVMDIFSGTGTMGLEFISRGAKHVVFVERNRLAAGRLKQNMKDLREQNGPEGSWTLLATDVLSASFLDRIPLTIAPDGYDLIMFDPPFPGTADPVWQERLRERMAEMIEFAHDDTIMTVRVEKHVEMGPIEGWVEDEKWRYGISMIYLYRPEMEEE